MATIAIGVVSSISVLVLEVAAEKMPKTSKKIEKLLNKNIFGKVLGGSIYGGAIAFVPKIFSWLTGINYETINMILFPTVLGLMVYYNNKNK